MKHKINRINWRVILIIGLICWFYFSSIIIASIFMFNRSINWLLLKDFVYFALFVFLIPLLISQKYDKRFIVANVILWLIIGISFIRSPAGVFLKFASVRQIMAFEIFFLIGYELIRNKIIYCKTVKILLFLGLIVVLFGLVERTLKIWHFFDLSSYFGSKNIGFYENGYPYFFIEPLPDLISNIVGLRSTTRMVSTILDPINLGHILVLCVALLLKDDFKIYKIKITYLVILFIYILGIFFTFSKGSWIQLIIIISLKYNKYIRKYGILFFCLLFVALLCIVPFHPGLAIHVNGLTNSIKSATLWGSGLGMAGNYSSMFGNINSTIGDTYIGAIIGQIGIVGITFWLLLVYIIYKKGVSGSVLGFVLISQLFVSILSENSFNILSIAFLFLLIGGTYRIRKSENKFNSSNCEKNNISRN